MEASRIDSLEKCSPASHASEKEPSGCHILSQQRSVCARPPVSAQPPAPHAASGGAAAPPAASAPLARRRRHRARRACCPAPPGQRPEAGAAAAAGDGALGGARSECRSRIRHAGERLLLPLTQMHSVEHIRRPCRLAWKKRWGSGRGCHRSGSWVAASSWRAAAACSQHCRGLALGSRCCRRRAGMGKWSGWGSEAIMQLRWKRSSAPVREAAFFPYLQSGRHKRWLAAGLHQGQQAPGRRSGRGGPACGARGAEGWGYRWRWRAAEMLLH